MSNDSVKKSRIILGEASESDSENEIEIHPSNIQKIDNSVEKNIQTSEELSLNESVSSIKNEEMKLIRKNVLLRTKICELSNKIIENAYKDILVTSKNLLSSELTLLETNTSLNSLRQNIRHLQTGLNTIVTTNYFPQANIINFFNDIEIVETD